MKFSGLSVALLASGALASTIERRQATVITGAIKEIQASSNKLDAIVKSFSGTNIEPLKEAGQNLVDTINAGNAKSKGVKELSLAEALTLQAPVTALTEASSTLVDDIKARKPDVEKAGQCKTAQKIISDVDAASNTYIDTVVSKVPVDAAPIAKNLVAKLQEVLSDAKSSYASCKDAAGAGPAPGGSSSKEPAPGPTGGAGPSASASAAPAPGPTGGSEPEQPSAGSTGGDAPAPGPTNTAAPPAGGSNTYGAVPTPTPPPASVPIGAAGALAPAGVLAVAIAAALL